MKNKKHMLLRKMIVSQLELGLPVATVLEGNICETNVTSQALIHVLRVLVGYVQA